MTYKVLMVIEKSYRGSDGVSVAVSTQVIDFGNDVVSANIACEKIDKSTVSQCGSSSYTSMRAIPLY